MLAKKQNFLEKIVKRNYNNELEKLLEEKQFEENAKSTLLNILYKIETGYKDIETVKKDIETKEEYIENLMGIIKNNCNSIKILKMSEQNNQILENRTYIIDKENKEINVDFLNGLKFVFSDLWSIMSNHEKRNFITQTFEKIEVNQGKIVKIILR